MKAARAFRILVVYLAASWVILQVTALFIDQLALPQWFMPAAILLLLIGLVVVTATAWVQAQPGVAERAAADEVPDKWEVELSEVKEAVSEGRFPHLTWARALLGGTLAFLLLFGLAGLYVVLQDRGESFAPSPAMADDAAPGIAVLPFDVNGPELEVWREGVVDLVSTNIDGAAGLRAIDSRTVLARWDDAVGDDETPDLDMTLRAARMTGARYAVVGNAAALGSDIRLVADIYDVTTGDRMGSAQVEGDPDDVYSLIDELSIGVLTTILGGSEDLPDVDLARVMTSSLPALKAYLEGEVLFRASEFEAAIPAYQRAVEADSTFALAFYRLSLTYGWAEGVQANLSIANAETAAVHADRLPEREATLVRSTLKLFQGDISPIEELRDAVSKYPDDVELWYHLGEIYFHLGGQALVPYPAEDELFENVIEIDPSFSPAYIHIIDNALAETDSARAAKFSATYRELAPGSRWNQVHQIATELMWGDLPTRETARSAVDTLDPSGTLALLTNLRGTRALDTAEEISAASYRRYPDSFVLRINVNSIRMKRGKPGATIESLEDLPPGHPFRKITIYMLHSLGYPLEPELLDEILTALPEESAPFVDLEMFTTGVYAAEQGRWDEHEAMLSLVRQMAVEFEEAGDVVNARIAGGIGRALEGVGAWHRGDLMQAATLLEKARQEATGHGVTSAINSMIRQLLGDLYIETGQSRRAITYWESLRRPWTGESSVAYLRLGRLYEQVGELEKARENYELFLIAFEDADPELQPWIAEAEQAIASLGFAPRD